jgi:hypothetical protein
VPPAVAQAAVNALAQIAASSCRTLAPFLSTSLYALAATRAQAWIWGVIVMATFGAVVLCRVIAVRLLSS